MSISGSISLLESCRQKNIVNQPFYFNSNTNLFLYGILLCRVQKCKIKLYQQMETASANMNTIYIYICTYVYKFSCVTVKVFKDFTLQYLSIQNKFC